MREPQVATVKDAFEELVHSDENIAAIIEYIGSAFPLYDLALGAMGQRDLEPPQAADSSRVRLKVEPVTTARVK